MVGDAGATPARRGSGGAVASLGTDGSGGLRRLAALVVPPGVGVAVAIALTVAVGLVDFSTSPYLVFATFYFAGVAIAAWYVDRRAGIGIGALAALAGTLSTVLSTDEVSAPIVAWNAAARFLSYAVLSALVSAARSSQRRLEELASTDPLTGIANRRRFYEEAEQQVTLAGRLGQDVAVVYLDLDGLKDRNDRFGHEAGDAMLGCFAGVLTETARATDVVGRVGGDEFCLLLPATDRNAAEQFVERLIDRLRTTEPEPIQVSAGIAVGRALPGGGTSPPDVESLVRRADERMLEAKRTGKGGWCSSGPASEGGPASGS